MPALFAFLHHLAAFTLVAAIAVEFVLARGPIDLAAARRLLATDAVLGAAAGLLLAIGLLRVFVFEKGAGFYFLNGFFLLKLALFAAIGLASILPTREFLSWRAAVREGRAPAPDPARLARVRRVLHAELAGIAVILLAAALMARGIGQVG